MITLICLWTVSTKVYRFPIYIAKEKIKLYPDFKHKKNLLDSPSSYHIINPRLLLELLSTHSCGAVNNYSLKLLLIQERNFNNLFLLQLWYTLIFCWHFLLNLLFTRLRLAKEWHITLATKTKKPIRKTNETSKNFLSLIFLPYEKKYELLSGNTNEVY